MNIFLIYAFLFYIGSSFGWVLELFFRRFFSSANPEKKWINPGFLTGPYVPLYGFGLCLLYTIANLENKNLISSPFWNKAVLFIAMAASMTIIEYIAGVLCLKLMNIRLWDYSKLWGNINGLICPLFSFFWAVLGAVYYIFVHPRILKALLWLSQNLAFSFFIGVFFGVFAIDFAYTTNLVMKIKKFASDNDLIVRYEHFKSYIRSVRDKRATRPHFFLAFHTDLPISENLSSYYERIKERSDLREHIKILKEKTKEKLNDANPRS